MTYMKMVVVGNILKILYKVQCFKNNLHGRGNFHFALGKSPHCGHTAVQQSSSSKTNSWNFSRPGGKSWRGEEWKWAGVQCRPLTQPHSILTSTLEFNLLWMPYWGSQIINWVYGHPHFPCPALEPAWKVEIPRCFWSQLETIGLMTAMAHTGRDKTCLRGQHLGNSSFLVLYHHRHHPVSSLP